MAPPGLSCSPEIRGAVDDLGQVAHLGVQVVVDVHLEEPSINVLLPRWIKLFGPFGLDTFGPNAAAPS